ncbi:MAG TPA: alpha/beta fold hydrolase [Thermoleophilaceae bacterium]|jgi:alpha-beta hydrolase superfamily lysophospholipase
MSSEAPEIGELNGISYALFMPDGEPEAGVLIMHGAGSAKESHFDFARVCVAYGFSALSYDARGHGRSSGAWGPGAIDDALAMLDLLRERGAPAVALRGSSMGGFTALLAGARDGRAAAVVAICPAPEDLLRRGLRSDRLDGFEADLDALDPWLGQVSVRDAAAALAPGTALLLIHAEGDEQVPYTVSQELHEAAGRPKRLLLLPGGHHRSLQHDAEIQAESVRFIARAVRGELG